MVGLVFAPDGRSFLAAADDDAVHEFRLDAGQDELQTWIEAKRQPPELTCEQRVQYNVEPPCDEAGAAP